MIPRELQCNTVPPVTQKDVFTGSACADVRCYWQWLAYHHHHHCRTEAGL